MDCSDVGTEKLTRLPTLDTEVDFKSPSQNLSIAHYYIYSTGNMAMGYAVKNLVIMCHPVDVRAPPPPTLDMVQLSFCDTLRHATLSS